MKFPDWSKIQQVCSWYKNSKTYTIENDGYVLMQCGAYHGKATLYMNNYPVLNVGSTDSISDNDFGVIPVKKGDVFSFAYSDQSSGAKDAYIWFMPLK